MQDILHLLPLVRTNGLLGALRGTAASLPSSLLEARKGHFLVEWFYCTILFSFVSLVRRFVVQLAEQQEKLIEGLQPEMRDYAFH